MNIMNRSKTVFTGALYFWLLFSSAVALAAVWHHPAYRAMYCMVWGLILLWVTLIGGLSVKLRTQICSIIPASSLPPWQFFIILSTAMALLEEAVTVSMTNMAPLFGVALGRAYITASGNYFDVVSLHSVVVIVPQFVAWGRLLTRYSFSPFQVALLFGSTGMVDEALFGGPSAFLGFAQWILVYGIMVFLPATVSIARSNNRKPVKWWHYPAAVVGPIFVAVPVVLLITRLIAPHHPSIHFQPISP